MLYLNLIKELGEPIEKIWFSIFFFMLTTNKWNVETLFKKIMTEENSNAKFWYISELVHINNTLKLFFPKKELIHVFRCMTKQERISLENLYNFLKLKKEYTVEDISLYYKDILVKT